MGGVMVHIRVLWVGLMMLMLFKHSWADPAEPIQEAVSAYESCIRSTKAKFEDKSNPVGDLPVETILQTCADRKMAFAVLLPENYRDSLPTEVEHAARQFIQE